MPDRILALFDFSNLAMRAFHGYGRLEMRSPAGTRTTLAHGVLSMAFNAIEHVGATHVAFALDSRTPTFRRALVEQFVAANPGAGFPEYKATRAETPPDYTEQLPLTGRAIVAMGWPWYRADGFEADDVLATLALQARASFDRTWIVTNDKDLLGVVDTQTGVLAMGGGPGGMTRYDPDAVRRRIGVAPEQITDWKALVGDISDNYPGCPGIGEKAAGPLIARFGSLDGLLANLHLVAPGARARLANGQQICRLSRELATLRLDAPVTLRPDAGTALPAEPGTFGRALAFCDEFGLGSVGRRLRAFPGGAGRGATSTTGISEGS